jgi:hypothetical protein
MNLIILFCKIELSEVFDGFCSLVYRNISFCGVKCYRQKYYGLKNHLALLVCIIRRQTQYKLMVILWVEMAAMSAVYRLSEQSFQHK